VKSLDDLRTAMLGLAVLGGALMVTLLVFGEWGARGLVVAGSVYERETNPLAIAGLAGCVTGAALFVPVRRFRWLAWPLRLAIVGVCLVVIVRSGSRGQLVAASISLLPMLLVAYRASRFRGLLAIGIAVAVCGMAIYYGASEFIHAYDARWSESLAARDAVGRWQMALKLLHVWSQSGAHIVVGLGNSASFDPSLVGYYPHNVPLEVLGEEGLIGIVMYLYVLWLACSGLLRARKMVKSQPQMRSLIAAVGTAFVFTFLISLKEGNMVGSAYFFLFAILLGRLPELVRAAQKAAARAGGRAAAPASPLRPAPAPRPARGVSGSTAPDVVSAAV